MFKNFDFIILFCVLIISVLGLLVIRSVAPDFFASQLVFLFFCFFIFLFFCFTDYRIFKNYSWFFYGLTLVLLALPFLFGQVTRGAVRWIQIGSFTFQPSEIAKPLLILFFAGFLSKFPKYHIPYTIYNILSLVLLLAPALLIFKQPDLGSALIVLAIWIGILLASGLNFKFFTFGSLLLVFCSPLLWQFLHDYQKARVISFINPQADPLGNGYNLIQSVIAIGSGRLFGQGLGRGTQSHLYFLPERHTDFIFASLVEEMGFFGGFLLLVFYSVLFFRILKIGKKTTDSFGFLIVMGVFSFLLPQAFIHLGINLGILPVTGITLPLVSAGGSSVLATMIGLGLVESVGRGRKVEETIRVK